MHKKFFRIQWTRLGILRNNKVIFELLRAESKICRSNSTLQSKLFNSSDGSTPIGDISYIHSCYYHKKN